jgi:membrane protein
MLSPRTLLHSFYKAGYNMVYHDGIEHAGYLAFLGLISLFPFLVFVVALAGFMGEGQAGTTFIREVFAQLPPSIVPALEPRIAEIISGPPQGLLTVAILGAIWTASSAVEGYRTVLNRAYHVGTPPSYLSRRLLSIAQTLLLSFAVVLAMLLLVIMPMLWNALSAFLADHYLLEIALIFTNRITLLSIAVMFVVVSGAYYILPNLKQNWHSVVPGAAIVTLLWMAAARALTFYLSQFNQVNLIYGSLGGIIAVLLFFYISNIIFIYGAELNYLIKTALGERIEQKEASVEQINEL